MARASARSRSVKPLDVVRRENDLDAVADIEPFGMVVHFLRQQCHPTHEAPGLAEGAEMIGLANRIAVLDLVPAVELPNGSGARSAVQPFDHAVPLRLYCVQRELAADPRDIKQQALTSWR